MQYFPAALQELADRLNVALASAEKYPNAYILCTGGGTASKNAKVTEAGQMAQWLTDRGISQERIITETVKAYGCTTEKPVRSRAGNRAVMNHPVCCDIIRKALVPLIGAENVIETTPTMGAESFSVLSAYYPSVMVHTGVGNPEKGMNAGGHSPQFEPDEAGFKTGIAAAVAYAQAFLAYEKPIEFHGFVGSIDDYLKSDKG